jgi:hypothetical protein
VTRSVPRLSTNKKTPLKGTFRRNCAKVAGLIYQPGNLATYRTTSPESGSPRGADTHRALSLVR